MKICDFITKYSIYVLVFFTPILFLPWTSEILDFNKQALLVLLIFVSLFSWMLKVLISGTFKLNLNKAGIFAVILFLAYLFSTIFSADKFGSFWGWPRITAESFVSIIGFFALYFIASNVFSKKEITVSLYVFSFSALIAEIFGIFQIFKVVGFNTQGSVGSLGVFTAILLPLIIILLISAKKWWKLLFFALIFSSAIILVLINYPAVWWVTVLGSALIIILGFFKRNLFDGRWMALPIFFLAVSLFFVILNLQINFLPGKANEVSLSQQGNFQIDVKTIKESPVFGSGLGTFSYDFSKFKNADFNKTVLWNVAFNNGNSKILTNLATTGVLGILALLVFIFAVVFYGGKFIFAKDAVLELGLFVCFVSESVAFFLYNSNFVLDFTFFFIAAILVNLIFEKRKEYELKPSSMLTLAVTFSFTLIFIFGLGLLILNANRYVAEINYYKGLNALKNNQLDSGIKSLEIAASINPGVDLYFSQLSQVYLLKIQEVASNQNMSQDDKIKNAHALAANSVNAAKISTDLNKKNAGNWLARGYVYQNLSGLITDWQTWAISSYNEALKLDPNNPNSLVQLGVVYYQNKDFQAARTNLEKALELKPDFSNGLYFLGLTYDQLGDKNKAIEQFIKLAQLNPDNAADIQKIIDNLSAGRNALEVSAVQEQNQPNLNK